MYMTKYLMPLSLLFLSLLSCKDSQTETKTEGVSVLQECIEAHGGQKFKKAIIHFEVGDTHYKMKHEGDRKFYKMTKSFDNGVHEVTYDQGLIQYFINDTLQDNATYNNRIVSMRLDGFLYTSSIPHYFNANDVLVSKLKDVTIRSEKYTVLHITFKEIPNLPKNEFVLYLNRKTHIIEYMALRYEHLMSQLQFRRMTNPREVGGVLFQDFTPFTPLDENVLLLDLYKKYNNAELNNLKPVTYSNINVN